jgi:arylsulfatase A-like enzyme
MRILVVSVRGLRADALGCYGNAWVETPALDALAAAGVVFDRHRADAADPAGARRAWRSGLYRLPGAGASTTSPPDLIAALRARGVHCCLVTDGSHPAPPDFAAGWDEAVTAAATDEATPLEATLAAAEAVLRRLGDRDDWLLWLDLATPLPPWDVPAEFQEPYFREDDIDDEEDEEEADADEEEIEYEPLTPLPEPPLGPIDTDDEDLYLRLQGSYAAAVSYLDAGVGQLCDVLAERGLTESVTLLVTADAGQELAEHGIVGPARPWLHEGVVHVPLLLRLPGAEHAGRRVEALTQAVDLAPTLAELFAAAPPPAHGRSLLALLRGEAEAVRAYACSGLQVGDGIEWALRTPEWAFLLPLRPHPEDADRRPRLYVKPDDRWEVNDVSQHHPELCEALERTLRDFVTAAGRDGPFEPPPLPEEEADEEAEE